MKQKIKNKKIKNNKAYHIVIIDWLDACGPDSKVSTNVKKLNKLESLTVHSVGWEIVNDKEKVILINEGTQEKVNGEDEIFCRDWIFIPKRYIVKRTVLK
jgi:hypothetical protein